MAVTNTRQAIAAAIRRRRGEILELTRELIRIPTENPPGAYAPECVDLLATRLREIGLEPKIMKARDAAGRARPSLMAFHGTGTRTLYFHGHYDVVPASSPNQFEPIVKGANLVGRGSSDMKSGLAAMIYAVQALRENDCKLDGRVGLVFVPDEETGGRFGSARLVRRGLIGSDGVGMLTAEPTGGIIWNACRGAISLAVTVKGKPAHAGLEYRGVNAFERMLVVAAELRSLKLEVAYRKTAFRISPPAARASILMLGGECESGANFNVVPGECRFTVDRRINPEEDLKAERKRLLTLLSGMKKKYDIDLTVEVIQEGRPAGVSEESELARNLAASAATVTGKKAAFEMCPGLLEIRFYAECGVPALAYGPGLLTVSHGPREFVPLANIEACAEVYALTAERMLAATGTRARRQGGLGESSAR